MILMLRRFIQWERRDPKGPHWPEDVRFYEGFGFEVAAEATVLGAPNQFVNRVARNARAGGTKDG